jgi:hypothetical protein
MFVAETVAGRKERRNKYVGLDEAGSIKFLTFQGTATGNATAWFDHMHLHSCGQFYSLNGWLMCMLKWSPRLLIFRLSNEKSA